MSRKIAGAFDREFVTIYFLQGSPEKHRLAIRRVTLILGLGLFVFVAIFLRVWQEMQIAKMGYELNQLKQEYSRRYEIRQTLLSRRNALANLARVEAIAKNFLGLKMPESEQVIFLPEPETNADFWEGWFIQWLKKNLRFTAASASP